MVNADDVRLYRQIVKAHEAIERANRVLKEVQEVQKKIEKMEKDRLKKIARAHSLAVAHHNLYDKLEAQKKGTNNTEKKLNIARAMRTVKKEREHLLRDIRRIQTHA